jgi:hypothetical protein
MAHVHQLISLVIDPGSYPLNYRQAHQNRCESKILEVSSYHEHVVLIQCYTPDCDMTKGRRRNVSQNELLSSLALWFCQSSSVPSGLSLPWCDLQQPACIANFASSHSNAAFLNALMVPQQNERDDEIKKMMTSNNWFFFFFLFFFFDLRYPTLLSHFNEAGELPGDRTPVQPLSASSTYTSNNWISSS